MSSGQWGLGDSFSTTFIIPNVKYLPDTLTGESVNVAYMLKCFALASKFENILVAFF